MEYPINSQLISFNPFKFFIELRINIIWAWGIWRDYHKIVKRKKAMLKYNWHGQGLLNVKSFKDFETQRKKFIDEYELEYNKLLIKHDEEIQNFKKLITHINKKLDHSLNLNKQIETAYDRIRNELANTKSNKKGVMSEVSILRKEKHELEERIKTLLKEKADSFIGASNTINLPPSIRYYDLVHVHEFENSGHQLDSKRTRARIKTLKDIATPLVSITPNDSDFIKTIKHVTIALTHIHTIDKDHKISIVRPNIHIPTIVLILEDVMVQFDISQYLLENREALAVLMTKKLNELSENHMFYEHNF